MKPVVVLVLSAVVALVVSVVSFAIAAKPPPQVDAAASPAADVARLAQSLAQVEARQSELATKLEELRSDLATRPPAEARVPLGEIEAAVARALKEHAASDVIETSVAATTPAGAPVKKPAASMYRELLEPGLDWNAQQKLWKEINDAGNTDAVIAMFEQRAKELANDPSAQVDLGHAYLQKIFKASGPEAGVWAVKADKAYDTALALDEHHWDARFSKAMGLSFWPPVFGKQGEAIKHFEILVGQQEGMSSQPQFVQTYLLLGNMYQQQGNKEKALASWKKGLTQFPESAELQKQISVAQGQ